MEPLIGVVHGSSIQFTDNLGLPEGQQVEVSVRVVVPSAHKPGDGFRRCAGALADDWSERDDEILAEIERSRSMWRDPILDDLAE
jgi:hypothetical protein